MDENVLYIICPGSGGYDAVAILVYKGISIKTNHNYIRYSLALSGLHNSNS